LNALLPDDKTMSHDLNKSYYHYRGSLTVPPCTEGVEHFVIETAVYVPKVTLDMIATKSMPRGETENNREVNQSFNDLVQYVE
jgi:carbonic anhydrase